MPLSRLQVTDFRCLQSVELALDPRFTLIRGPNGSGKTSLLEAMYVLGRGRSFRTRHPERLIRHGRERFVVFGEVELDQRRVPLGVEGERTGLRSRIAGAAAASLSELALLLPVQIIDPEVHRLIEEGPSYRRRFLDWGVFHVEHDFVSHWRSFQKVLLQRNAALRTKQPDALVAVWDPALIQFGGLLTDARSRYVTALSAALQPISHALLGAEASLHYRCGWSQELSLTDALQRSGPAERVAGTTQVGPHRADLHIRVNGLAARDHISRGQQKLLSAALLLAQLRLFSAQRSDRPTLLLDDPAAELDAERLAALIGEVQSLPVQLVVTSLRPDVGHLGQPGRLYEVDAGVVRAG